MQETNLNGLVIGYSKYIHPQNDGLIRVTEAKIDGIPLDVYSLDHFQLCANSKVFWRIIGILKDNPPVNRQVMMAEAIQTQQEETPFQEAPMISGKINSNEEKSHKISISATNELSIMLSWLEGDLNLTLTTPSGTLIDYSTNNTNITYYSDENITIESCNIKSPEQGIWKMNVTAVNISKEEDSCVFG